MNVLFQFDEFLYKFFYLTDVLFKYRSKLELVRCSEMELGRYGTGTRSGTWTDTGRTSNRILNSPQETSTRSRTGKHRTLGSPNGCLALLVALEHFFGSSTMIDTHLSKRKDVGLFQTNFMKTTFCLTYVSIATTTPSTKYIEHWAHVRERRRGDPTRRGQCQNV